jgi:hypothetical protein
MAWNQFIEVNVALFFLQKVNSECYMRLILSSFCDELIGEEKL